MTELGQLQDHQHQNDDDQDPDDSSVYFASFDPRADPAASDPVVQHEPVVGVEVRARAGSVQPNLAKIGDQRRSSADNPGKRLEDWELDDPAGQDIDHVRAIRDEINRRVEQLIGQMQPIS